ncbi:PLDc N-terminal domain-containing protein [Corynebacterium freiburgense]|uniref:PLDc N-terminal domain-containing protein n=1 Tax=Corynebacterium freiburgense TaxID=556548 RepID=UPI000403DB4D|nr:PLDc N-terminal domain-containing protein [Corynebacterium freiburgense]
MGIFCAKKSACKSIAWNKLTGAERSSILGFAAFDIIGKLAAWHLLYHRPAENFRGPKWLWFLISLVNGIGPVAFFTLGRK